MPSRACKATPTLPLLLSPHAVESLRDRLIEAHVTTSVAQPNALAFSLRYRLIDPHATTPSRACDHAMRRRRSLCCSHRNRKSLWRTGNLNGKTEARSAGA
ncbi:hypothetical protein E2562_034272 [Oryza meyeriana var. granulata]|uniref:Uncharacterized protein n=1 Tax=Oryza meyeriana var. granulata TaxID=110450 RepID=A0A6G1FEU8_9ORYZ|nr:hypothetical protein E2562_034272 [Oryza meyeriana var. granulata]